MQRTKYNIFYTDDDADDRDFFSDIVSEINEDYSIFTQKHGDELLQILQNPPPSPYIVFLDLNMPQKNGYEVLKEIRGLDHDNKIPVVIFSTSNDDDAIQKTKDLGANLYITKPASYNDYKKIMNSVLSLNWSEYTPSPNEFVFTVN